MRSALTKLRVEVARCMQGLVLDVGTGDGIYSSHLGGDTIIHLDIGLDTLRNAGGLRVVASAHALPFANDAFDSLWACAVIEHVREDTLPEFCRVVKPGGRVAVLTPNRYSPVDLIRRLFGSKGWWGHEGHVRLYSVSQLAPYGEVKGDIWWLPIVDDLVRPFPRLGHTLMLHFRKLKPI